jgi:hypothetical protein
VPALVGHRDRGGGRGDPAHSPPAGASATAAGAAGAHADLLDAFVAHAVAYRAMLAACRHGDPAGARTAAERVNATAAARDRAWDAIVDALAADVRSPARRGADEAPR